MKLRTQWMGMAMIALIPAAMPATVLAQGAQERESIEPGVATSSAAEPAGTPPAKATPSEKVAPPPKAVQPPPAVAPASASKVPAPSSKTASTAQAPAKSADAAQPAPSKANDRLELDPTQISGNRELPRVMYVVPWRRPDMGEFAGRPPNSLLDEVLAPVDRDVFRRQNSYYTALQPDTSPAAHKDEK
jgi:hypothetical protein